MSHKHFPFGPALIAIAALIFCTCSAKAQGVAPYDSTYANADFKPGVPRSEVTIIGDRPAHSILADTNCDGELDLVSANAADCSKACTDKRDCEPVPYDPGTILWRTEQGEEYLRTNQDPEL